MSAVEPIRSKADIERMKKSLHGRDLLLFTVGINSALRISDILKLKVGDLRGKDYIAMKEKKTGKTKRFEINKSIKKAIKELVPADAKDDDWLFPSRKGGAITRVQAYRILNAASDRAGLKMEIGTHTMRKTFSYFAYRSGVDLAQLMTILNHSSQRETLKYIGVTQEQTDDVYRAINL